MMLTGAGLFRRGSRGVGGALADNAVEPPAQAAVLPPDAADVLAALPVPVASFDAGGRWTGLNEAAEIWLNLSTRSVEGLGADDPALISRLRVSPELGPLLAAVSVSNEAAQHPRVSFEVSDRAGGWSRRRAALHLAPLAGGGTALMIRPEVGGDSPRRAARSAIGMAEMLAHEIKNPVAGIRGAAQLLAEGLSPEDRELTDLIVAESRRIVALLDEVERFGDTTEPQRVATNIHDILDRARRSVDLGGGAPRMVTEYDPSLPAALVDPDRMMQVVLNLVRNAAEALSREGARAAGDVRGPALIRLRTHYDGSVRAGDGGPLPLHVEIEDNGPGIPELIADQIFEPFVSGRENGTGLGLALVGKIVTEHGGRIHVDSRPGRTVFRVSLPMVREGES